MIVVLSKICTKCGTKYPATTEFFKPRKRYKNGLGTWCRMCERKNNNQWCEQHRNQCNNNVKKWRDTIKGHLISIYRAMKQRCNDPKNKSYKNYGDRGIKLCFTRDEFVDYVMNELKVDPRKLDVDRINNNGHYEKGNIRFVTRSENLYNRGSNERIFN